GLPLRPAPARSWRDPARARHHRASEAPARGLRRSGGSFPDRRSAGPASISQADGHRRARAPQPHCPLRGAGESRDPPADHMNLATPSLGLSLPHPLMSGASPLVDDLDMVRRLEDAGAAAIVMHSLFEEQIAAEEQAAIQVAGHDDSFGEALSYLPGSPPFALGPDRYLEQLRRIREAVAGPVIASLNGLTARGWLEYAGLLEQAGAHALELNVYHVATDPAETAFAVEARVLDVLRAVRAAVRLPLAVKLSPFYSAMGHLAQEL